MKGFFAWFSILRGICWITAGIPGVHGNLRLPLRTSGPPTLDTSPWLWCRLPGLHLTRESGVAGENSYCAPTSPPTLGNTHSSWPSWMSLVIVVLSLFFSFLGQWASALLWKMGGLPCPCDEIMLWWGSFRMNKKGKWAGSAKDTFFLRKFFSWRLTFSYKTQNSHLMSCVSFHSPVSRKDTHSTRPKTLYLETQNKTVS